jgi:hypothetical protein
MADKSETTHMSKDDIRSKIFSHKSATKIINVYGIDIELRSPTVRQLVEATSAREGESKEDTTSRASVMAIVAHCYVPGTDSKIFSEADAEALMALPMDTNYRALQEAISDLMGIKKLLEASTKN